jgi:hypothetical protein
MLLVNLVLVRLQGHTRGDMENEPGMDGLSIFYAQFYHSLIETIQKL